MTLFNFDGFIFTDKFNPEFPGYKKKGKYVPLHNYVYWENTGLVPKKGKTAIHHIDGDRNNNEFENLNLISVSDHCKIHNNSDVYNINVRKKLSKRNQKKGLFGYTGIRYHKKNKPWFRVWGAKIRFNGFRKSLGYFNDPLSGEVVYLLVWNEIYSPLD